MSIDLEEKRAVSAIPTGADTLAVRERYLHRRRPSRRAWVTLWVIVSALIGWLFIAGFSLLGH